MKNLPCFKFTLISLFFYSQNLNKISNNFFIFFSIDTSNLHNFSVQVTLKSQCFYSEAAVQRCSYERVFNKHVANLQEKTHADVALLLLLISWLFSEHPFQRAPLDDCFCFYCSFFSNFNNVLNPSTTLLNDSSDRNVEIVQDLVQLFSWNFSLNVFFQCLSCFWVILVQAHHFIKKESLV